MGANCDLTKVVDGLDRPMGQKIHVAYFRQLRWHPILIYGVEAANPHLRWCMEDVDGKKPQLQHALTSKSGRFTVMITYADGVHCMYFLNVFVKWLRLSNPVCNAASMTLQPSACNKSAALLTVQVQVIHRCDARKVFENPTKVGSAERK